MVRIALVCLSVSLIASAPLCGEGITEGFEEGHPTDVQLREHADWFYEAENEGPTAGDEIGVAGGRGLTTGERAFTWQKYDFDWSDEELKAVVFGGDWQTDGEAQFDDDRLGWTTSDEEDSSNHIFGVQLDPDNNEEHSNIECYWDGDQFGDDSGRASIVTLKDLEPNTWYRLRAKFIKLSGVSAKIEVRLVKLDQDGNETETTYEGTLEDTSELSGEPGKATPNEAYFNTSPVWPVYKNFTAVEGGFDNAYFEIVN